MQVSHSHDPGGFLNLASKLSVPLSSATHHLFVNRKQCQLCHRLITMILFLLNLIWYNLPKTYVLKINGEQ